MFKLNTLVKTTKRQKRVGRGNSSGHGTYSTRGLNGQGQRKSYSVKRNFEGGQTPLVMRMPKLKGFKPKSYLLKPVAIRIDRMASKIESGKTITKELLKQAGLIGAYATSVKIVGVKDYKLTGKYTLGEGVKSTKSLESMFN